MAEMEATHSGFIPGDPPGPAGAGNAGAGIPSAAAGIPGGKSPGRESPFLEGSGGAWGSASHFPRSEEDPLGGGSARLRATPRRAAPLRPAAPAAPQPRSPAAAGPAGSERQPAA